MSVKAADLSKSSVVLINRVPHTVTSISVQTPSARGGSSIYKIRYRNARTGQKLDQTHRGDDALEEVDLHKREVQFLYRNGDEFTFMDLEDYSQIELKESEIESSIPYLVDDMEGIIALISGEQVLGITMPEHVDLQIVETDPSIKGASATARTKPATLSTGLVVQVPEYISNGEVIRINTQNSTFVSRA